MAAQYIEPFVHYKYSTDTVLAIKDLFGEKTPHPFQVCSGLQLDTKNSKIHLLDCKNCICTVFVMQS